MASDIDWERIEADFRAGQLSNREIAKAHGISDTAIRKKAKEKGWTKDLSDQVRAAVRSKVVRSQVRTEAQDRELTDAEVVERYAERGAEIQGRHQRVTETGADIAERMLALINGGVKEIEASAAPKNRMEHAQRNALIRGQADLLASVVSTLSKVIPLERQAFNLEDGPPKDGNGASVTVYVPANGRD